MGKIMPFCGFDDEFDEIWDLAFKVKEITGKDRPKFLLVPTTAFDEFNRGTLNCYHKLGCEVDKLLLGEPYINESIIKEKISRADIIFVPGGNVKYLMETWKKTGADKYIRQAYEDGALLMGTSGGGMCWFGEGYDNCAPFDEKMFVGCMNFYPYCICPHYQSENWKSFDEAIKTRNISGIAIEDGAALCLIDGDKYIFSAGAEQTCYYFDAMDNFKKYNLKEHPEILKTL